MFEDWTRKKRRRKSTRARKSKRSTKKSGRPAWLVVGMLCGLFFAFLLQLAGFWPAQLVDRVQPIAQTEAGSVPKTRNRGERQRPKYTFYETLPNSEVVVDARPGPARQRPDVIVNASNPREYFQLQAGSFTSDADAERRRADITLLGFSANISKAQLNNRDLVHRVTVGPFTTRNTVAAASNRLASEGIDSFVQARSR